MNGVADSELDNSDEFVEVDPTRRYGRVIALFLITFFLFSIL